jgi:hypothetical protein
MRYSILGFNQEKLMQTDLDLIDIVILQYIQQACGSTGMSHKLDSNGNPRVWIYHQKLIEDLPILRISEATLRNRLSALNQKGYVELTIIASESRRGSRTYYGLTDMTMSLIYDTVNTTTSQNNDTVEGPRHFCVTSDSKLKKHDKELKKHDKDNKPGNSGDWMLQQYNDICTNLPKVRAISDKRKKAIQNIMNKYSKGDITECFNIANESSFLTGHNDRGWKADLDFILREDKFINILEGKYSTKSRNNAHDKLNESGDLYVKHHRLTEEEKRNGEKF